MNTEFAFLKIKDKVIRFEEIESITLSNQYDIKVYIRNQNGSYTSTYTTKEDRDEDFNRIYRRLEGIGFTI